MKVLLIPFLLSFAFADIPEISYGGSGCPAGTVSIEEESETVTTYLDQMVVEANSNKRLDRKSCALAMTVPVPEGYQVSLSARDYSGYAYIDGGHLRIRSETFIAGRRGPVWSKTFRDYYDNTFVIAEKGRPTWSGCGQDVTFRVNFSLMARARGGEVYGVLGEEGISFDLKWKKCD